MQKLARKLADNLRKRRGELPQRTYARKLGISVATLNRLEQADQNVTLKTLEAISNRLKCPIGELFE